MIQQALQQQQEQQHLQQQQQAQQPQPQPQVQPQQPQAQPQVRQVSDEEVWSVFDQAVKRMFMQWTALQLAVQHEWGGRGSDHKAEEMRQDVLDLFLTGKPVYPDMIVSILEDVMSNDLNTVAEDGSCREIADLIIQVFGHCVKGMFNEVVQIIGPEMTAAVDRCVKPAGMNEDSDSDTGGADDDDEMMDDDSQMDDEPESKPKKNEPDDDGWVTVGRKGR
ncbi:hypothetical protein SAMD00019534_063860 [Acytostelium subglobosum LB1]|uniref:hypothetical protein n=1 Tax=Acytostelium subglobosum LB1 TaxID=1410327 RepID=UPI000644FC49|nr:hypothetical protein SAMD00019534_063860 [Acytostelium subglobosum LB1]GAM23211.1 hypothetical protein SAMD00019534_063860 [Acytostelium subglobosum LB1]|eukprot:XP_012753660.1 hypothetical protein SAMD00019534_063860 [Acytostelium subglobosum LB1]